jgi:hypothetical protein
MAGIWNDFIGAASAGASAGAQLASAIARREELASNERLTQQKLAQSAQAQAAEEDLAQQKLQQSAQQSAAQLAADQQSAAAKLQAASQQQALMNQFRQQREGDLVQNREDRLAQGQQGLDLRKEGLDLRQNLADQINQIKQDQFATQKDLAERRLAETIARDKAAQENAAARLQDTSTRTGIMKFRAGMPEPVTQTAAATSPSDVPSWMPTIAPAADSLTSPSQTFNFTAPAGTGTGTGTASAPETVSTGDVRGGYRFKGGDPKKKENWEAIDQTPSGDEEE